MNLCVIVELLNYRLGDGERFTMVLLL